MTWMENTALELVLMAIAWIVFRSCSRSLRDFFDLRLLIQRQMRQLGDAGSWPSSGTMPDADPHRNFRPDADHPAEMLRHLGIAMLLLAEKARLAIWIVKLMGYDPIKAGDNLIGLSRDVGLKFRRRSIAAALRFEEESQPDQADDAAS
jgi:hypothetical protein